MAHNLFHANYGDYKKSSPDTAVLLLLSKVRKSTFDSRTVHQKYPCALPGAIPPVGRFTPALLVWLNYPGILARIYSRSPQYGVPTRYHSLAGFISILV